MINRNAIKFCEVMADINDHFDKWCLDHNYARIDTIYGCWRLHLTPARKVLTEYLKQYKFTAEQYRYWNQNYAFHYGEMHANSKI